MANLNSWNRLAEVSASEKKEIWKIIEAFNISAWTPLFAYDKNYSVIEAWSDFFVLQDPNLESNKLKIMDLWWIIKARLEIKGNGSDPSSWKIYIKALFSKQLIDPNNLSFEELWLLDKIHTEHLAGVLRSMSWDGAPEEADAYLSRTRLIKPNEMPSINGIRLRVSSILN